MPQQRVIVIPVGNNYVEVSATNPLPTSGGGGGGAGDASAANQTLEIARLVNLDTNLGAANDTAANADTGTFSLIAITKRIVAKLTSIANALAGTLTISRAIPVVAAMSRATISTNTIGDNTIVALATGQTVRVHKMIISPVASPVTLLIKDGAATTLLTLPLNTYGSMVLDFDGEPWFITTAGNALVLNLSAAVQVYGRVYYSQS